MFDEDKDGFISGAKVATVIRALGKNPFQKEADEIAKEAGDKVDLATFTKFYRRKFPKPADQDRDMRAAFEALDKDGNGTIMEAELRQILTTLGEALDHKEMDFILRDLEVDSLGMISYDALVDKLVS